MSWHTAILWYLLYQVLSTLIALPAKVKLETPVLVIFVLQGFLEVALLVWGILQ